jgi:hypothetical protein
MKGVTDEKFKSFSLVSRVIEGPGLPGEADVHIATEMARRRSLAFGTVAGA